VRRTLGIGEPLLDERVSPDLPVDISWLLTVARPKHVSGEGD
jgi:hypothetical protein